MTENNLSHTIRKQNFEVEFYGTESEGLSLQRFLPFFCHNLLIPAIENVLDRYVPANAYLTIDRLDIDAGSVGLDHLEHELPQMVVRALEKYFQGLPQTNSLKNTPKRSHIQRKTIPHTIIEAFIFFLKHGTLPWSFHLPSGSGFEELIQGSLKEQEGSGGAFELLKNEVIDVLASATARKRLIQQFTPSLHETVLELISAEGKKVISAFLPLLHRSDAALIDSNRLEQEVWECVFACVASGNPLTERYLRRETKALATALGVRGASMAAVPDSAFATPTNLAQQSDDHADEEQKFFDDERAAHGPVSSKGDEQSNLPTGNTGQAKRLTEPTNPAQQSDDHADDERKVIHHERKVNSAIMSDKEEQSDPLTSNNDQVEQLSEPASSSQRFEGAGDEAKESRQQLTKAKESVLPSAIYHPDAKAGIYTALAGLVLLHPFLPQLFRALCIADDKKLLKPNRAIRLLYFLATGRTNAMEYELVIPKILCQFPLESVVESNINLADADQEEAIAMLAAVIHHWEVMKNTGADGLRETFLKRSGKLSQRDDGEWLLQVESNSFDILLEQLPWGISMIQLPWMPRMLRVEWI
jgi:Contractile injection system tape measure protein